MRSRVNYVRVYVIHNDKMLINFVQLIVHMFIKKRDVSQVMMQLISIFNNKIYYANKAILREIIVYIKSIINFSLVWIFFFLDILIINYIKIDY